MANTFYTLEGIDLNRRVTHGFIAHADEVVAEVILRTLYDAEGTCARINTRDQKEVEAHASDFIFDCGGGVFDHHSSADRGIRYENGIILSAAGKILEAAVNDGKISRFAADYLLSHGLYAIQAQDNGQDFDGFYRPFQAVSILSDKDSNFETLVAIAATIFSKLLADAKAMEADVSKFGELARAMENIVRSEYMAGFGELACAWNQAHPENQILFHIFPSIRGGYMGETVKRFSGSFQDIVSFSQDDKEAAEDSIFVHPAGFLCQAQTEEGVIKMCRSAMKRAQK